MPKKLKLNGSVIGDGSAWFYDWLGIPNISPQKVSNFLDEANGEDVDIYVNSGGGLVFSGSEIYTMLKDYSGYVTVYVTGVAASAASVFPMGADKVVMSPTSQIMIHNASALAYGDKNEVSKVQRSLQAVDESIANAYVAKTGMSREDLLELMNQETWMDALKAKELGFADEVMFENAPVVTNSIAGGELIPNEIIDRITNAFHGLITNDGPGLDIEQIKKIIGIQGESEAAKPKNEPEPQPDPENKEENPIMNMDELKEKHPELYAELVQTATNAGIDNERKRIASIREFANTPGAAPYIEEAITKGDTVEVFAMKMLRGQAEKVQNQAENRKLDAQESGLDKVNAQEPAAPSAEKEAEKKKQIENEMLDLAKNYRPKGGR